MKSLAARPSMLFLLLICLWAPAASAGSKHLFDGWVLERDTAEPSYAAVTPVRANVNVDTVVLACVKGRDGRLLQLQLYLLDEGIFRPLYPHSRPLNDDPRAEITIDGKVFPATLLFADDYVVVADSQAGRFPLLSGALLDAMQAGTMMTLRFDLLTEWSGPSSFDSEAVVDLKAPGGRAAIAAMRLCAEPGTQPRMVDSFAGH